MHEKKVFETEIYIKIQNIKQKKFQILLSKS